MSRHKIWAAIVVVGAVAAIAVGSAVPAYLTMELTLAAAYALGCLGLNIVTGFTGQVSLGHSFFFATGAFVTGWLITKQGFGYIEALPIAIIITAVIGYLFAIPAARLSGFNLGLVTLGLGFSTSPLAEQLTPITGGHNGLSLLIKAPFGMNMYDFGILLLAVGVLVAMWAMSGQRGRSALATRDREDVAKTLGINTIRVKAMAFATSGAYAAAGGWLYAGVVGFLAPNSFPFTLSVYMLLGVVVAGTQSLIGAVIAGVIVEFLPTWASQVSVGATTLILGAIIMIVIAFVPNGLGGLFTSIGTSAFTHTRFPDLRILKWAGTAKSAGLTEVADSKAAGGAEIQVPAAATSQSRHGKQGERNESS